MSLLGAAVSAARNSSKISSTRATIDKLNTILTTQLATYDSRNVVVPAMLPSGTPTRSSYRAWFIRRNMITGDMPDRWTDVQYMATPANGWVPQSPAQRAYISIWNSLTSTQQTAVMASNASAECLFMVVMRGGIADCLDCGSLKTSQIGDQDGDGMPEFWDDWGNPIGYLLWAPDLELPAGSGRKFFSGARTPIPFQGEDINANGVLDPGEDVNGNVQIDQASPTLGLRPLIYSAGPDGRNGFERWQEIATLKLPVDNTGSPMGLPIGRDCGNPQAAIPGNLSPPPIVRAGGQETVSGDTTNYRADNITNLDVEAKQ
jgi:hypothetical protein